MSRQKLLKLGDNIYYNPLLDEYLLQEDKKKNPFPLSVCVELTRRCNFSCKHCSEVGQIKEMSLKQISKVIDNLKKFGVRRISVSGGEPLLRKDFLSIIKLLKDKDMIISLSTNGYLLNEEIIKNIKGKVSNVRVSLHGDKTFHDRFVGVKGAYERIIKNIKLLEKYGIPTGLVCTVMQSNISEIMSMIKLAEKLKVQKITFYSLFNKGRAIKIYEKESMPEEMIREVLRQYRSNKRKKSKTNLFVKFVSWEGGRRKCLIILPDGSLVASPFPEKKDGVYFLGNLRKQSFQDLWECFPFKAKYYAKHFSDYYY